MTYGKDKRLYVFPNWAVGVGWLISIIPLFFIPGFIVFNLIKFKRQNKVNGS